MLPSISIMQITNSVVSLPVNNPEALETKELVPLREDGSEPPTLL